MSPAVACNTAKVTVEVRDSQSGNINVSVLVIPAYPVSKDQLKEKVRNYLRTYCQAPPVDAEVTLADFLLYCLGWGAKKEPRFLEVP